LLYFILLHSCDTESKPANGKHAMNYFEIELVIFLIFLLLCPSHGFEKRLPVKNSMHQIIPGRRHLYCLITTFERHLCRLITALGTSET